MPLTRFTPIIDSYCTQPYIAIIANGEVPTSPLILEYLKGATYLICCDGAISYLEQNNITPTCIIGDCDSISSTQLAKFADIIIRRDNQNYNDLTKSIMFCTQEYPQINSILIVGAFGLREDHAIGNFSVITEQSSAVLKLIALSDYGMFISHHSKTSITYPALIGQQISFFANNAVLNCKALKWQLQDYHINNLHQATLNQATNTYISVDSDSPILIYFAFCIK